MTIFCESVIFYIDVLNFNCLQNNLKYIMRLTNEANQKAVHKVAGHFTNEANLYITGHYFHRKQNLSAIV